jgi:hypothetical protein
LAFFGGAGSAENASGFATKVRPMIFRVQPSFSAFVALAAIDAFAASNVGCVSVIPRSVYFAASVVVTKVSAVPSRLRRARIRIVVLFAVRVIAIVFGVFGFAVSVVTAVSFALISFSP